MILDIFMPEKDTATIDLPLKTDIPLILGVIQKKQVKEFTEKYVDLKTMTRQFNVGNLSQSSFEILGEAADTVDSVLDNHVVKKLKELAGVIASIHVTDLQMFS